jgi:hypothetical protein
MIKHPAVRVLEEATIYPARDRLAKNGGVCIGVQKPSGVRRTVPERTWSVSSKKYSIAPQLGAMVVPSFVSQEAKDVIERVSSL